MVLLCQELVHSNTFNNASYKCLLNAAMCQNQGTGRESKAFKKPEEKKDGSINRKRERWTNVLLGGCLKEHGRS